MKIYNRKNLNRRHYMCDNPNTSKESHIEEKEVEIKLSCAEMEELLNMSNKENNLEQVNSDNKVKVIIEDNTIRFYDYIDIYSVLILNQYIDIVTNNILVKKADFDLHRREWDKSVPPLNNNVRIFLHLQSPGGVISAALSVVDKILSNPIPIDTIIEGSSESAATLISTSGAIRYAYPNSVLLLHQMRVGMSGKLEEIKDEMYNTEVIDKLIKNHYINRCININEQNIEKILSSEKVFLAKEAKQLGIIDHIIEHKY